MHIGKILHQGHLKEVYKIVYLSYFIDKDHNPKEVSFLHDLKLEMHHLSMASSYDLNTMHAKPFSSFTPSLLCWTHASTNLYIFVIHKGPDTNFDKYQKLECLVFDWTK